jgi:hypothetical protein
MTKSPKNSDDAGVPKTYAFLAVRFHASCHSRQLQGSAADEQTRRTRPAYHPQGKQVLRADASNQFRAIPICDAVDYLAAVFVSPALLGSPTKTAVCPPFGRAGLSFHVSASGVMNVCGSRIRQVPEP